MNIKKLFFDIETEADQDALKFMKEPEAPKNYKDQDKIDAYIEERKKEIAEKAALDMDFGKITAIGMRIGEDGETVGRLVTEKYSETRLLNLFWRCFRNCNGICCGYNIINFDLPYILRRSFALGVKVQHFPDLRRYNTYPTIDLMQILANWNRENFKGLKFICARYGIENELPELDGSQYASMDDETKLAYVKSDVDLVFRLYQRMKGYYL